ncbi:MAG: GNAT family N-acetyltransferase [Candidatus Pacebacteria bacterium CG_4_10_14_3_um_filter_34_15]|nr:GNAT family N-acetyltransferase [Candidatus Pacearchaeota archaeon]NCQ65993.1 GNAT family N-acetyltransferase [Candidatus Paceibacterota bacterium]PIQ80609.1 MAG: GNAT family N-acetyltransferase [Candidatus Pacebacteria bacterium CG11_big_fil_rev_8_21_14_0_20_34_55]PIX81636.1 MAG: GNAT family N-acetyltransferase [Candidatus Pacebacteria bacterium CG_4_10_14_3_um_filter_34_15]PJC43380.1 MAG: GNAT family N-acetyltransferase [Candidatus Pacebacteria bacterium CG_4_9_14_0_2_um_filter_34_50]
MNYQIKNINLIKDNTPIDWATKEGWNPGVYDAKAFHMVDSSGFFVGYLGDKVISSLSAVSYDKTFGFLGFYIVKPEYRGKEYGIKIWNEALKHLPTQNIGLDGVVGQQDNYKKSGFKLAYKNIRYQGKGIDKILPIKQLVSLSKVSFDQLQKYDDQIFPTSRPLFLKEWIKQPDSLSLGYVESGELIGYGMVRKCKDGFKVGPLFANNANIAHSLFQAFRSFVGKEETIFLDVPEPNKMAMEMAKIYKMKPVFETARMYTKEFPKTPIHKVFGVTTFELG